MIELWTLCAIAACYVVHTYRVHRVLLSKWEEDMALARRRHEREVYWDHVRRDDRERQQRSADWTQLSQLTADVCHKLKARAMERGDFESAARMRNEMCAMRKSFLRICNELEVIEETKP